MCLDKDMTYLLALRAFYLLLEDQVCNVLVLVSPNEMVGWHQQLDRHEFEQAPELVMDREAWHAAVHVVSESWTGLNN